MNYFYNILSMGLYEKVRNYIENNNGSNKKKIIARNWTGLFHATG